MSLLFEWDAAKDRANYQNEAHSQNEDRFISIGATTDGRVLVVVYTERSQKIRLISSRIATNAERRVYEEER